MAHNRRSRWSSVGKGNRIRDPGIHKGVFLMNNFYEQDVLLLEVTRERSIRRTVMVLETKRKRIREDLLELIQNMPLLALPVELTRDAPEESQDILLEALSRMGDEAFARWIAEAILDRQSQTEIPDS
ncbi:hypothetical protein [Oscillatoria acuminata]|nr:hypothetical protein [Oscillatoria acuminata]